VKGHQIFSILIDGYSAPRKGPKQNKCDQTLCCQLANITLRLVEETKPVRATLLRLIYLWEGLAVRSRSDGSVMVIAPSCKQKLTFPEFGA
jgi:hypothetical protein